MKQNIHFAGYTAQPSDFDAPDGQLALALNLVHEHGSLSPAPRPATMFTLASGQRLIYVHAVSATQSNYLILRPDPDDGAVQWLVWCKAPASPTNQPTLTFIDEVENLSSITSVGSVIIFSDLKGIRYIRWADNAYRLLGSRPPFVSIDFGMALMGRLQDSDDMTLPACCHPAASPQRYPSNATDLRTASNALYGLMLPAINERIMQAGYFYMPFFVRYAFRLFDGSYAWHSAPVLMLPHVCPPLVKCGFKSNTVTSDTVEATSTLDINYFSLMYRTMFDASELKKWEDVVTAVDIFISAPIYTYKQGADLEARPVRTLKGLATVGSDSDSRAAGDSGTTRPGYGTVDSSGNLFIGHYADGLVYQDHTLSTSSDTLYWNIPVNEQFNTSVISTYSFYRVASLPLAEMKPMDSLERLELDTENVTSLAALPVLPDEYLTHARLRSSCLHSFNSRLIVANTEMARPEPLPVRSLMQFGNPGMQSAVSELITIRVYTRGDDGRTVVTHLPSSSTLADTLVSPSLNLPRFIYHPDPAAFLLEMVTASGITYRFPLKPHDFLNGAYYYNSDFITPAPLPEGEAPEMPDASGSPSRADIPDFHLVQNKIYTSEPLNPFLFPATGIVTVGFNNVLGVASAAKALSQGQFGQFPLYAFTDHGVWALEISSTGAVLSRQPITRDVCTCPEGITPIDSAVLFPTSRGIMMLQGSSATCISDPINSDHPFQPRLLQLFYRLTGVDVSIPAFSDFCRSCRMLYDYPHQLIIIYASGVPLAFLYSLRSGMWTMMQSDISYSVNAYPEALAVDAAGHLLDFSKELQNATPLPVAVVTRPLNLDEPDIFKTVRRVIPRGDFRMSALKMALYGSRNLASWQLLRAGEGDTIHGFSGSPYKYFRLLICSASLAEYQSISAASFDFVPRLTNRLR